MYVYTIYDKCNNVDFPNGVREDIGEFYVEENYFDETTENGKCELAHFFSGMSHNFISDSVFFDKKEANKVALWLTLKKLNEVSDKISRMGGSK